MVLCWMPYFLFIQTPTFARQKHSPVSQNIHGSGVFGVQLNSRLIGEEEKKKTHKKCLHTGSEVEVEFALSI